MNEANPQMKAVLSLRSSAKTTSKHRRITHISFDTGEWLQNFHRLPLHQIVKIDGTKKQLMSTPESDSIPKWRLKPFGTLMVKH